MRHPTAYRALWTIAALFLASGCATRQATEQTGANDPFEPVNRVVYKFNDTGDRYVLRPIAVGYRRGLPSQVQAGIHNFFSNLMYPVTVVNDLLQGKFRQAGQDGSRLLINSTVGLAGLFDPATRIGLAENDEDFGQTLGVWGVPEGPYLVLPLLGPRTTRHAVGTVADSPLTPFTGFTDRNGGTALALWGVYSVDKRSGLLDLDQQVYESFDPYLFVRDAYLQHRRYKVRDGKVPDDSSYLESLYDLDDADKAR